MRIIYRISDVGYSKTKPNYITNEKCLANATEVLEGAIFHVIADNTSPETNDMIQKYITKDSVEFVSKGNGAATFNLALDKALTYDDDEIIYFLENDYLHKPNSLKILNEAFELGASFVSLYDHPDKYLDPNQGGNPYCKGGAEDTRVYKTDSSHWKITNSTTMTFAAKVSTLKENEDILRKHTSGTHPNDFQMFLELREQNKLLITPIPGYSTHGETAWLSPLIDWSRKEMELEKIFNKYGSDKGNEIGPKHSYSHFYEKFLKDIKDNDLLILEIGVCGGKSLKSWGDYCPNSTIIGLDIEDKTIYNNDRVHTFKVDQSDPLQLQNFVNECKERGYQFDIILDDGSHHMLDQQISLGYLFPLLKSKGIYFIEDLHTSLVDNGFPLYGKRLDIHENRKNTTLFYLMESLNSIYLTPSQNQYLIDNINYIEIHNRFNRDQEPEFKFRSITSSIIKI